MNINTPYALDKNLGAAYNDIINRSNEKWVIVKDADVMFLTPDQPKLIPEYIVKYGSGTGIFTCYCNRVGYSHQRLNGVINQDDSIRNAIKIAEQIQNNPISVTELPSLISGFFMIINKRAWREIGGFKYGLLGVDDDFSRRIANKGYHILRMDSIYLWHSYRINKDFKDTSHL